MDKRLPPDHPDAAFVGPGTEISRRANRFTVEEMKYNVAVSRARESRAKASPPAPETPRANGWRRMLEILT